MLTALAPGLGWAAGLTDANLASTVLVARVGAIRFLFTGDAEAPEEEWLLSRDAGALAADVLKVGHHGSRTSTTPALPRRGAPAARARERRRAQCIWASRAPR